MLIVPSAPPEMIQFFFLQRTKSFTGTSCELKTRFDARTFRSSESSKSCTVPLSWPMKTWRDSWSTKLKIEMLCFFKFLTFYFPPSASKKMTNRRPVLSIRSFEPNADRVIAADRDNPVIVSDYGGRLHHAHWWICYFTNSRHAFLQQSKCFAN